MQTEEMPRDGSLPKNPTTLLTTFERLVGRSRAWGPNVALDYAAGLSLHVQTAFWEAFWTQYGHQSKVVSKVFEDATVERMVGGGVPEIIRLRVENILLRAANEVASSKANESMYHNLTCGGRAPHDYGDCPSCR